MTYKVIRTEGEKEFKLGVFAGLSKEYTIKPFAYAILTDETTESIKWAIERFFYFFNSKPTVFITDEQKSIASALLQLTEKGIWEGEHLLDNYHILKNVGKKLGK